MQALGEGFSEVFWEASTCYRLLGYREALRTFWMGLKSAPTCLCPPPLSSYGCLQGSSCIKALRNDHLSEFQRNSWGLMAKLQRAFWGAGKHLSWFQHPFQKAAKLSYEIKVESYWGFQIHLQNLDNSTPQNCGAEKELSEDSHANKSIKLPINFCLQTLHKLLSLSPL